MKSEKLRLWFVEDNFPRSGDYEHQLPIKNLQEMQEAAKVAPFSGDGLRMYLGDYEIGKLWKAENDEFFVGITAEYGNGILAVIDGIFDLYTYITKAQFEEIFKNGISLEEFIVTILAANGVDAVVTDNPNIAKSLINSGYMSALALKDAAHVDIRDGSDNESVLFIKHCIRDTDSPKEVAELPIKKNKLWFVRDDAPRHEDYTKQIKVTSAGELLAQIDEITQTSDTPEVRVYLGEYEIGGIAKYYEGVIPVPRREDEASFAIQSSGDYAADYTGESIGARLEYIFGTWAAISSEKMDELLAKEELTIEELVEASMNDYFKAVVTDDSKRIWELLHSGYTVLCTLNDILHQDIKNNYDYLAKYKDDKRVILVSINLDNIMYAGFEDEEEE